MARNSRKRKQSTNRQSSISVDKLDVIWMLSSFCLLLMLVFLVVLSVLRWNDDSVLYLAIIVPLLLSVVSIAHFDEKWRKYIHNSLLRRKSTLYSLLAALVVEIIVFSVLFFVVFKENNEEESQLIAEHQIACAESLPVLRGAQSERYAAFVYNQPTICLIDYGNQYQSREIFNPYTQHGTTITALCFLSESELLALHEDLIGTHITLDDGHIVEVNQSHIATAAACDQNNSRVTTGDRNGDVRLLNLNANNLTEHYITEVGDAVTYITYRQDSSLIAVGLANGQIKLLDALTGDEIFTVFHESQPIIDIEFSPDGSSIFASATSSSVKLWTWDDETSDYIRQFNQSGIVDIVFSNSNPNLLLVGGDEVTLWNLEERAPEQVELFAEALESISVGFDAQDNIFNITAGGTVQTIQPSSITRALIQHSVPETRDSTPQTNTFMPSSTLLAPSPTVHEFSSHRITLFYDENSFYLWNPSQPQLRVEPLTFESLNSDGLSTKGQFEGLGWTQFYGFVETNACVSMEITQSPAWLRPSDCRYHNSLLLPHRDSEEVFWIQHADAVEFRVLWDGEEIARCPIADGEQDCYIIVPE